MGSHKKGGSPPGVRFSKDFSDAVADVGQLPPIVMSLGHGSCRDNMRGVAVCQLHVVMGEREAGTTHFYRSYTDTVNWLVVWNRIFIFPYVGNFIIPTDELIFFRGVGIPPANQFSSQCDSSGTIGVLNPN